MRRPRVRIAPSPTGDPHVGTAYMALFNYAYARKNGGTFVLRIEDTDQARYSSESEQRIVDALAWLGVKPDEGPGIGGDYGPYRQSERLPIYRQHADQLIAARLAYPCFCTKERLEAVNHAKQVAKQPTGYDRQCRTIEPPDAQARIAAGEVFVVRLAVPLDGTTIVPDLVRGDIEFENDKLSIDPVLMKSDGFPTYHLAVVIDDHLMDITLVLRGEEWVPSAPLHVILYGYFGWDLPEFVHMPLLRNADRSKVSKRKNNTSLDWYRDNGYLPEALLNFLALNGWSMPDGRETFTLADMIAYFSWDRIATTGPVFDLTRLTGVNAHYLQRQSLRQLRDLYLPLAPAGTDLRYLEAIIPLIHERVQRVSGAALGPDGDHVSAAGVAFDSYTSFFFTEGALDYEPAMLVSKKTSEVVVHEHLGAALTAVGDLAVWDTRTIESALRALVEERGVKPGEVFTPIRVAVTGSTSSPPLFETMAVLGPDRVVARLRSAVERLATTVDIS